MKKIILGIVIGLLISSIAFAADVLTSADNISYTDDKTVSEALNDLLGKADATAEDILAGKTAYVNGELITGTALSSDDAYNAGMLSSTPVDQGSVSCKAANATKTLDVPAGKEDVYVLINQNKAWIEWNKNGCNDANSCFQKGTTFTGISSNSVIFSSFSGSGYWESSAGAILYLIKKPIDTTSITVNFTFDSSNAGSIYVQDDCKLSFMTF